MCPLRRAVLALLLALGVFSGGVHAEAADLLVKFKVQDAEGHSIQWLRVGDEFSLNVYVEDLRAQPHGVASAYMDVLYDSSLASVTGPISYGQWYGNFARGSTDTPGVIDDAGGATGMVRPDPRGAEYLLFSVPMQVDAPGMLNFTPDPSDGRGHMFLLAHNQGIATPFEEVLFVPALVPVTADSSDTPKTLGVYFRYADTAGNAIDSINVAQEFHLEAYIQDIRAWPYGVAGANLDVLYDPALASVTGPIEHGPMYRTAPYGNTDTSGLIDEVGAVGQFTPPKRPGGEFLLFRTKLRADSPGTFVVTPDPADGLGRFFLLWDPPDGRSEWDEILFVTPTLTITSESQPSPWTNPQNRHDVNADGNVNPLDGLFVITELETNGYRELPNPPTAADSPPPYYDVSGDGSVSPLDVLWIFDFLAGSTGG